MLNTFHSETETRAADTALYIEDRKRTKGNIRKGLWRVLVDAEEKYIPLRHTVYRPAPFRSSEGLDARAMGSWNQSVSWNYLSNHVLQYSRPFILPNIQRNNFKATTEKRMLIDQLDIDGGGIRSDGK